MRIPAPLLAALALSAALSLALPGFASTAHTPAHVPVRRPVHHSGHASTHHAGRRSAAAGSAHHRNALHRAAAVDHAAPPSSTAQARPVAQTLAPHTPERHSTIPTLARIPFVPPLRGSRESLLRQNERDTAEGLVRIQDDAQLNAMRAARELVVLPASSALAVNPGLPYNRRYCRPWTAHFLSDLASSHYQRFHRSLQVNSAVRTVDFQRSLMLVNGNAAAADGDLASPHLTGAAIDIGKKGLSESEIAWMRAWLLPLQTAGKIDVEEEFYQSCFHITVYSSYAPSALPRIPRAPRRHSSSTLLAANIR
jgi:hypothetical protein